jgi:hypothetical protein
VGRTGHRLTGLAAGVLVAAWGWVHFGGISLTAVPAGYFGGTAPDWLEISRAEYSQKYQRWMRKSVIPHRTITHWWPLWMMSTIAAWFVIPTYPAFALWLPAALGFLAGGWMHLIMDIPNPTGIPIKTPRARSRYGLGWWKSGNALEPAAGVLMLLLAVGIFVFVVCGGPLDLACPKIALPL